MMPRIFVGLAIGTLLVLLAAGAIGPGDADSSHEQHVLLAVFALLLSSLVQVGVFTYLSVAGKIVAQALHLGHLDLTPLADVRRLKRAMMSIIAVVFACVVLVTASGASSWRTEEKSIVHAVAAGTVLLVHFAAFYREYTLIVEMASIVQRALRAYEDRGAPISQADHPGQ